VSGVNFEVVEGQQIDLGEGMATEGVDIELEPF